MRQKKSGTKKQIQFSSILEFLKSHKIKLILIVAVGLFVIGFTRTRAGSSDSGIEVIGSPVEIQKQVSLRAKNSEGDTLVQTFDVTLTSAQLQQRVLVRGTWIKAREGKRFLVVNMDVKNNIKVALYAEPQDWLRLVKGEDKQLAPTAHQGTIEIRPLATKETNVGFVVDAGETNFTLQLGTVDGLNETIEIEI